MRDLTPIIPETTKAEIMELIQKTGLTDVSSFYIIAASGMMPTQQQMVEKWEEFHERHPYELHRAIDEMVGDLCGVSGRTVRRAKNIFPKPE